MCKHGRPARESSIFNQAPLLIRARSRFSTFGGTRPLTSPPKLKTFYHPRAHK